MSAWANTSTSDEPRGISIYLRAGGDGFLVSDSVGTQYGRGETSEAALADWSKAVAEFREFVAANDCAPRLRGEAERYRKALAEVRA